MERHRREAKVPGWEMGDLHGRAPEGAGTPPRKRPKDPGGARQDQSWRIWGALIQAGPLGWIRDGLHGITASHSFPFDGLVQGGVWRKR